jgi:hypothetical protein
MNATETTVGHDRDDVSLAEFGNDVRHDLIGVRQRKRGLTLFRNRRN